MQEVLTMREILFRGKRIDNGEWVTGAFLNDRDGACYICPVVSDTTYGDNGNRRRIGCWYAVDPSTVGQYTGLIDKNGKRIFEGDIVCLRTGRCHEVKYGDGCFYMDGTGITAKYLDKFTVIGNIHDNPELLVGGTDNA